MKRFIFALGCGLAALTMAPPAHAQDIVEGPIEGELAIEPSDGDGAMDAADMARFAETMGALFQTDPLTIEQEARLPAARAIVAVMMPDGFYSEMMGDVMEKAMQPMIAMFSSPEFVLSTRLSLDQTEIEALGESERRELVTLLDPAWDRRGEAIVSAMTGNMGTAFEAIEPPMRDGLARAYAVRFDERELADIATFFATPTGRSFGQESLALFADPQVIGASMQALPQIMGSFGDLETAMMEAIDALPPERDFADLSSAEKARAARLLDVSHDALEELILPPQTTMTTFED